MAGGGAERVASQLLNEFHKNGIECEMVLTSAKDDEVVRTDLDELIQLTLLSDSIHSRGVTIAERTANALCKPFELAGKPVLADLAKRSFIAQYDREINLIRQKLEANPEATAIAFLQPAIPMLMLAADGLPNRVIFSERADPNRLMKHRYGKPFIEEYYKRADYAVFQTYEAQKAYPGFIQKKSAVISNPVKDGLPEAYYGERNKTVVTFCRISLQKNLLLLVKAFAEFHKTHSDHTLKIIGDAVNEEGRKVKNDLLRLIAELELENAVEFKPFSATVHEEILHDGMYINSSDYEGISNAMLEAMSIGMPVVCTDCPIGGAKQTITDGENGLLVPVGDAEKLAEAMCKIADDAEFARNLSVNAAKLREELSLENIAKKWMDIL